MTFAITKFARFGQGNDAAVLQSLLGKFFGTEDTGQVASGLPGGSISLPRILELEDTVWIDQASIHFVGQGAYSNERNYAATSNDPAYLNWDRNNGSVIRWEGAAGAPMFHYTDYREITWEHTRFEGNTATPPNTVHHFERTAQSSLGGSIGKNFEHCQFGQWAWSPAGTYYGDIDRAILCDGINGNNDRLRIDTCRIYAPQVTGIEMVNSQSVWNDFKNLWVGYGGPDASAIKSSASIDAGGLIQIQSMDRGFDLDTAANVHVLTLQCENTRELARIRGGASLEVMGGRCQVPNIDVNHVSTQHGDLPSLNGYFIDATEMAASTKIAFEKFVFGNPAAQTGMAPIAMRSVDGSGLPYPPTLRLIDCFWGTSGEAAKMAMMNEMLDDGVVAALEHRVVEINPMPDGMMMRNHLNPDQTNASATLDFGRWDIEADVYGHDVSDDLVAL